MDPIFPQPAPILPPAPVPVALAPVSATPAPWQQDRIARLTALTPQDATAGLLWLAMNFPAACDTMLDKIEYDAIDDPDPGREPGPYRAQCGARTGIFPRSGPDRQYFPGDGTAIGQIELFDPGTSPWSTGA